MEKNLIIDILAGSISQELGIEKGDYLVSINGINVQDCIEYKYQETSEYLELEIEKRNGETWIYEIDKEMDENLGIIYENALMDEVKTCSNKCIFCFIDQLPKGMRKSLYLKDDDSRLSFLLGNFLTLTNMSEKDIDKIIEYGISPIKISIHTTNPKLREKMLNNKNAGNIINLLDRFKNSNIIIDSQIVLVPEYNDGEELINTINELYSYYPTVRSVAVVPVGITKHRTKLVPLRSLTIDECLEYIKVINELQKKFYIKSKTRFVYLSDEFFLNANIEIPKYKYYEDFNLIENGVGMIRLFENEIEEQLQKIEKKILIKNYSIITGSLAYEFMIKIAKKIKGKFEGLKIDVIKIENNYFGTDVTVSGLITASDILMQSVGKLENNVLIPKNMLKNDEDVFLDNISLKDLEKKLNVKIKPIEINGLDLINEFIGEC